MNQIDLFHANGIRFYHAQQKYTSKLTCKLNRGRNYPNVCYKKQIVFFFVC